MVKTITIVTLEQTFKIHFESSKANCWSCAFPERFFASVERSLKFNDSVEILSDGVVYHSGSLVRIMEFIAEYIGQCEV